MQDHSAKDKIGFAEGKIMIPDGHAHSNFTEQCNSMAA
jgi:hypothetical protein